MCVYLSQCSGCNPYESFLILAVILSNATSTRRPSLLITCMFSILCFGHRNTKKASLISSSSSSSFSSSSSSSSSSSFVFQGDFLKFSPHLFFVLLTKFSPASEKINFFFFSLSFSHSPSTHYHQYNITTNWKNMVAPSYNRRRARYEDNERKRASKKKKIALKRNTIKQMMQSGDEIWKAKRKAFMNSRRAEQNKIDEAIRKSKEDGDMNEKDVEMKDFD